MSITPGVGKPSAARLAVRAIKLAVSGAYLMLRFPLQWLRHAFSRNSPGTAVVLYYHNVPSRYKTRFEWQMRVLANTVQVIALDDIDRLPAGAVSVAVTFDDGLQSFAENAVPILEKFDMPATVFAVPGALGERPVWGDSYYDRDERVMSEAQLRRLPEFISVGSHTSTHANLTIAPRETVARELTESRRKLEFLLQRPITTFCFPYGEFDSASIAQCREVGYKRVFTTTPSLLRSDRVGFVVGRVAVDPWDWMLEYKLKILGAYSWEAHSRAAKIRIKQLFRRKFRTVNSKLRAEKNAPAHR